ncbi:hypothetical protein K470DRAFT_283440 [Piedraia hortae CBS 480.64]|uniref:MFS general substrate transporter n=1 Tax=Piedraia hortae CBS 480.64 TaxID=1314780 RepID=A0A6A7BSH6_9PEZI|nr:hypothetical protein K470DRAFT_283440 [Piedraia hortae CBS 480.64]
MEDPRSSHTPTPTPPLPFSAPTPPPEPSTNHSQLEPSEAHDRGNEQSPLLGECREESKSSIYLFLLTVSMGGLQLAWSVELSNGSPYLLGLALVWIAGPLSGTLVQPYVGLKSDQFRSRFGRRRPFMVGGALATTLSFLVLAWAREIVSCVLSIFGMAPDSHVAAKTAIILAVTMIYILDFSINVVQAAIRAFIVDNAPQHQQDSANAWASRLSGVGNIVGYLFGYTNLPKYLWFFGNTQFKVLSIIACVALFLTLSVSCLSIQEADSRRGDIIRESGSVSGFFKDLIRSVRKLPPQVRKVCLVQLAAWIGWFPFLFYITTYVGEIYVDPIFKKNPHLPSEDIDRTWEHATRIGTFSLLIFSLTTFAASVFLPLMVAQQTSPEQKLVKSKLGRVFSLEIPWLTLRRTWMLSHILFFILTWLTFAVSSVPGATVLVAFIGIPWAVTNWAPFALIAAEISREPNGGEAGPGNSPSQTGVVLGIHNVAIAAPQVIATLVSSAIFKALQKPRGSPGDDSVAWVLRFGGLAALVAALLTTQVEKS